MNMALCAGILEGEHGSNRIYSELLVRWPYALEAAFELVKRNQSLEPVIGVLRTKVMQMGVSKSGSEIGTDFEAKDCARLAMDSLLSSYKRWNRQMADFSGGFASWSESEAQLEETLKVSKYWPQLSATASITSLESSSKSSSSDVPNSLISLRPPRMANDPLKSLCAMQQEMWRGSFEKALKVVVGGGAMGGEGSPWIGSEYVAYSMLRSSNAEGLNKLVATMQRMCPYRWETWYATALREWMHPPRSVASATEWLNKSIVAQPTHPLLLITRAYMHVYKVKDSQLKFLLDENASHKRHMAQDARLSIESAREAFSHSKDPLITCALLHIYSLLAPQIPDAKYIEILGDVDALNPVFKRYKQNPASILQYARDAPITAEQLNAAQHKLFMASDDDPIDSKNKKADEVEEEKKVSFAKLNNAHLASLYSHLLSYRAKMCIAKPGLVTMGMECAEHALKLNPENALSLVSLIVAKHSKRSDWNGALEELNACLESKVKTRHDDLTFRLEVLQTLEKLGEPDPQAFSDIAAPMIAANKMDEDAVFWLEYINIKIRQFEEDQEGEEEATIDE